MNEEQFWREVLDDIETGTPISVVVIIQRDGSAPNVPGAKMLVSLDKITGTVGGGDSEHKLAELAKETIKEGRTTVKTIRLIHNVTAAEYSSGMICSGSQTFAIVPLSIDDKSNIEQIIESYSNAKPGMLSITEEGLTIELGRFLEQDNQYSEDKNFWIYQENLGIQNRLFIVGGGHVSLALSKIMETLDFHITVFDNRENLPTMISNIYANKKELISFNQITDFIPEGNNIYVTIMTFGHKSDEFVLEKLIEKNIKYIGMMASPAKKQQIFTNLREKGISNKSLNRVYSPIGLMIKSNTPEEIAISIAAEIVKVKNS